MSGILRGIDYNDPVVAYRGERIKSILARVMGKDVGVKKTFLTDIYYIHYLPFPILKVKDEIDEAESVEYAFIESMLMSDVIDRSRNFTVANSTISVAFTVSYVQNLIEELERISKTSQSKEEREAAEQMLRELKEGETSASGNAERQAQKSSEAMKKVMKQAHERAIAKAVEDANAVKNLQKIVGGQSAGTGSVFTTDADIYEVLKLARNSDMKKILEFLSGMPKIGAFTKKKRTKYVRGELYGYEEGTDLERIVPSELALPEELFHVKFAEGELLLYQKEIKEALGPLYLLLDKSGSMDGEKILWAKAVALALYNRARRENRDFYLRFFDNIPYPLVKVSKNAKAKEVVKMIEYISKVRGGGGTDISRAIITATEDIKEGHVKGVSDIIILTDGEDKIAETTVRRSLREANSTLISVMIRGENADLRRVSDVYLAVYKLDHGDLLKVVEV
ncbi:MAG: vWA domain-containing protein [Thermoprotei archaeon]